MSETVIVRASVAPMHAEARVSSVQISQRFAGHRLEVIETHSEWLRVRGEDGYDGWMHRGYVTTADARDGGSPRRLSLGCVVHDSITGVTRGLPLGAWVASTEQVVLGEAIDESARGVAFPHDAQAIARTAVQRFSGTPYQWGGISAWGADCSGLVQTVFWLHGISLPRDAWQQAEVGEDAGGDSARWMAADLVFFSDRADSRITHVGIALGESRMVHLALGRGGYAVERLDATDDGYLTSLRRRFVIARRVVASAHHPAGR